MYILFPDRTAGSEVRKACEFLLSKQMEDGGWGEEFAVRSDNDRYKQLFKVLLTCSHVNSGSMCSLMSPKL